MADIKATDVAKLRKMTGAGMMDCKNALVEANGDFDKAQEIIRKKGQLIAAKRADRETSEGAVIAKVKGNKGIVVALGCETDFVAINSDFVALANKIADAAINNIPASLDALKATLIDGVSIEALISEQTGKSGEKHDIVFYKTIEGEFLTSYIHLNNKLASLVCFNKHIGEAAGKDVAMQVAAMNPVSLRKDDCPADVVEKELRLGRELAIQEGKPENIIDKIAEGRLGKFYKENTLEEQDFIKDSKMSVKQYVKSIDADAKITGFIRFSLAD